MKNTLLYILLFFVASCEKPYDNPPVQSGISSLVIDCTITNDPPPYTANITMSTPYNGSGISSGVRNAKVSIIDEAGNIENMVLKSQGTYSSSASGMIGQIGKSYKLKVNLLDGKGRITDTYESEFVKLVEAPTIDTVYAESGQYLTSTGSFTGLSIYIDATPAPGQDYYYKLKSSMIQEIERVIYPFGRISNGGPPPTYISYIWYSSIVDIPNDLKANSAQNLTYIKKLFVGFVPEYISNPRDTDSIRDPRTPVGIFTTNEIYSVPKRIFDIFTEENSQIKPANSIFDPIPTQLETNITCTSNPAKKSLGYFAAASIVRKFHYFYWNSTSPKIYSFNVDSLPKGYLPTGVDSAVPPSFWIRP